MMNLEANTAERLPYAVANICFGTSALGDMPDTYGYSVDADRARQTLHAVFQADPCFIDTSRNYGMGRSEARIGEVIAELGGLPAHAVMSTKLDRDMETNRFDGDRARRSIEESLTALGLQRVHILHLHDPEYARDLAEVTGKGGALEAIFRMKEEGLVDAVGLAMGRLGLMQQLLSDWEFDALISHNRYTLLNREADAIFTAAHDRGIAVFNAAPFASGMLAKGSASTARIAYQDATPEERASVRAYEEVCARFGLPLGAAALQFSIRDRRITSTIVGVSRPERVQETLNWAAHAIPEDAWAELLALPFSMDDPEATRDYRPT
jgi:D-threo-aldose 1-dehydrogenase